MHKPKIADFLAAKPLATDFGITSWEYVQFKKAEEKKVNWLVSPAWTELWASYGICIFLALVLAFLRVNSLLCFGIACVGPVVFLPIWFVIIPFISGLHEGKNESRYEDSVLRKIRLYEHALVYYHQAPVRYEQAMAVYSRTLEEHWKSLKGRNLEDEVATLYRKVGYSVETTKIVGDGGVDLILQNNGQTTIVQCKGYGKPAGVGVARDLYGALMDSGADSAALICPSGFTKGVTEFVRGKPVRLITATELVSMDESPECSVSL